MGFDRSILAFFALAFAIAWSVFGAAAWVAAAAGLSGPVELLSRTEALDLGEFANRLPVPFWVVYLGTRVADFSFTLAALIVIAATEGSAGLRVLTARFRPTRASLRWLALGLVPLAFYALATFAASRGAEISTDFSASALRTAAFSAEAGIVFSFFLRGAMGEEPGLRGFALARMQPRVGAVRASLTIGVLWALWHLPVLWGRAPVQVVAFLVLAVLLSFVMTWLFNGGAGSLIPPMLFHAAQNSEEVFETVFPFLIGSEWETVSTLALLLFGLAVTVRVVSQGRAAG